MLIRKKKPGKCGKHEHKHCQECAEACRKCAEACRNM
ncbi:MAG: four-helix bundle copper-binding protein [Hymenobacter sp.]|nr:MAG: four-helix bundle copper-binding protein [Hymenobacter sp.]